MILAILSNGWWMCLITPQTINSDIFIMFVSKLKEWISKSNQFGYASVSIILDNWPSHRSFKSKEKLRELGYFIVFLPQYSPQLAPIEMAFSLIKKKLRNQVKWRGLDLKQMTNYGEFRSWMMILCKDTIRALFKEFYNQLRLWLYS